MTQSIILYASAFRKLIHLTSHTAERESEAEPNLENVTDNVKFQYFAKEFASPQAIYLAESLGNAILDTGCSKTVCGELWLTDFAKKSNVELKTSPSSSVYRFGDGDLIKATKKGCVANGHWW